MLIFNSNVPDEFYLRREWTLSNDSNTFQESELFYV